MSYEHLIAGVFGGLTSTLVLHPLDLLKIRFAVSDGQSSLKRSYLSITNAFSTIVKEEGYKGLYKGVAPNCMGAGAAWGLYFLFYNSIKKNMLELKSNQNQPNPLGPIHYMTAAACAGALTTAITNPIWVVKTRLCLQYGRPTSSITNEPLNGNTVDKNGKLHSLPETKRYSGSWDALKKVYKYEGLSGLYKGFVPGLLGVSHGAIQLAAYEEMKKLYISKYNLPSDHNLGTLQYLSCAASSKLIAASVTYPYQVVRARLQDQYVNYNGVIDVVKKTWRNEGAGGFYKGLGPSLLRVVPASAITFVVYENALVFFKDIKTD